MRPDLLGQDLKYAARMLRKSPGFAAVALLSLGLGLGVVTTAFTFIDTLRLRALPYPNAHRLVVLGDEPPEPGVARFSYSRVESFEAWARDPRAIDAIAGTTPVRGYLTIDRTRKSTVGAAVSPVYFRLLDAPIIAGRAFTAEDDKPGALPVALISERLWRSRFAGDVGVIGQPVRMDDRSPVIVGIVGARVREPSVGSNDFWIPLTPLVRERREQRARAVAAGTFPPGHTAVLVRILARLAPGVSRAQASAMLVAVVPPDSVGDRHAYVSPLGADLLRTLHSYDLLLGAVAAAVLLIACANLGGLVLVRQVARAREFAVRSALGAEPGRITRQLVTESVLLTATAGALGALLAAWGVQALRTSGLTLSNLPMALEPHLDARVLVFLALVTVVAGLAVSVIPARQTARRDLQHTLRESAMSATRGAGRSRVQQAFVVAQLACASALLGGTGIMTATWFKISPTTVGFDVRRVVEVTVVPRDALDKPPTFAQANASSQSIQARIASMPGVQAVGLWSWTFIEQTLTTESHEPLPTVEDTPQGLRPVAAGTDQVMAVDVGFFRTLAVPTKVGRAFTADDRAGSAPVGVIDEATARRWWPRESAVGKRVRIGGEKEPWVNIVGVVGATRGVFAGGLGREEPGKVVFRPWSQAGTGGIPVLLVRSAAADASPLVALLRDSLQRLPNADADVRMLNDRYESFYGPVRANMIGMLVLAASGLIITLIGVYGVVAYAVSQRTQEFGIRVALGARQLDVLRLVMSRSVAMTAIGLGIGLLGTFALQRAIRAVLLDAQTSSSPTGIAVAAAVFLVVVLLASYIPARQATRVDPTTALKAS